MVSELTVILKDEARTYRQKFLMYDEYMLNENDPAIIHCIHEAKKSFEGDPDKVQIRCHLEVQ